MAVEERAAPPEVPLQTGDAGLGAGPPLDQLDEAPAPLNLPLPVKELLAALRCLEVGCGAWFGDGHTRGCREVLLGGDVEGLWPGEAACV